MSQRKDSRDPVEVTMSTGGYPMSQPFEHPFEYAFEYPVSTPAAPAAG
jgi:hypothetical protein